MAYSYIVCEHGAYLKSLNHAIISYSFSGAKCSLYCIIPVLIQSLEVLLSKILFGSLTVHCKELNAYHCISYSSMPAQYR